MDEISTENGKHYAFENPTRVTFQHGEVEQTIPIRIIDNSYDHGFEGAFKVYFLLFLYSFLFFSQTLLMPQLRLQNPSPAGCSLTSRKMATVKIRNDEKLIIMLEKLQVTHATHLLGYRRVEPVVVRKSSSPVPRFWIQAPRRGRNSSW